MRAFITLNSVEASVLDRTPGPINIDVHIDITDKTFIRKSRAARFAFKLTKKTRTAKIALDGSMIVVAEGEEELAKLEEYVSAEKPPLPVVNTILTQTQPLILHIEEELRVPIIPFPIAQEIFASPGESERDSRTLVLHQ